MWVFAHVARGAGHLFFADNFFLVTKVLKFKSRYLEHTITEGIDFKRRKINLLIDENIFMITV